MAPGLAEVVSGAVHDRHHAAHTVQFINAVPLLRTHNKVRSSREVVASGQKSRVGGQVTPFLLRF